jgi:hypothetical protein
MAEKKKAIESVQLEALIQIRASVCALLNIPPDAALTDAEIAEAVRRICHASRDIPSIGLLARDLDDGGRDGVDVR